ncbi:MAG: DNA-deoxyinosine glycosylase [Flavobacterium sp.]|nr:DNA-deoxyinosine glycosylase [Flavobacterium sp.]
MKIALPPIIDAGRVILILGTMPGEKSIASQQYYANRGNQFWRLLFAVFDEPFSVNYDERLKFLQRNRIGLWNVLEKCNREGSSDNKIKNEHPNDLPSFFERWPNITHVYFESMAAAKFYAKYFEKSESMTYNVLPSTSGQYAVKNFEQKLAEWKTLQNH